MAGFRTTKGLFFIFTLLCLVCLASSQVDKMKLEYFKENHQKLQQDLDTLKAERVAIAQLMSDSMNLMDPLIALVKKTSEASPDFPPMEGFVVNIKGILEKTKNYVDRQNEELDARIESSEQKLGTLKKVIKILEEQLAEL